MIDTELLDKLHAICKEKDVGVISCEFGIIFEKRRRINYFTSRAIPFEVFEALDDISLNKLISNFSIEADAHFKALSEDTVTCKFSEVKHGLH